MMINTFARTLATTMLACSSCQVSTAARELKSKTFKTSWLSDPATYPILVIMSFATGGCTGFMTYKFMYCNDVRVSSGVKGKVIRDN